METQDLMLAISETFNNPNKDANKVDSLYWEGGKKVFIQSVLNDSPPPRTEMGSKGIKNLSTKEYANRVKKWKKNFVGGRLDSTDSSWTYWYPPEGSSLHELEVQHYFHGVRQYYLLLTNEGAYFLLKEMGTENTLQVLSKNNKDDLVLQALVAINTRLANDMVTP